MNKRYWVIRMGDFVELRSSIYPIKAIKTKLVRIKMIKQRQMVTDLATYSGYRVETVERPLKTVLEQTYFEGGKILTTFLWCNWPRVSKDLGLLPLKIDSMFNVPREVALVLQRRKG